MKQTELDAKFILIMDQMITMIVETAGKSSEQILNVSQEFLSQKAHQAIQDFYSLYFNPSDTIEASKAQMNKDVDDLFDQAQEAVGSGLDVSSVQLSSSNAADSTRLQLSGVQKDLEALITMEEGLRSKLTPVLHNMQFEDACRQRLEHIVNGWRAISKHENQPKSDPSELLTSIQESLTSVAEESLFITEVLEEDPPENMGEEAESILFF